MEHQFDSDARYAESHEWARLEDDLVAVGISDFAQDQLSDVVYVELPEVGARVFAGEAVAVVESVKAAEDVYSPISGTVVEVNEELEKTPEMVNSDAFGAWFFKVKPSDLAELDDLMDAEAYEEFVAEQDDH